MDVPEIVEEIIETLLAGLRDAVCLLGKILQVYISLGEIVLLTLCSFFFK